MKKFVSVIVSIVLSSSVLGFPVKASAAGTAPGIVATSSGSLNVRSAASSASSVVSSLNKGSYVTLHSQSGAWWRVEFAKNKYGYVHGDYIRVASGSTATVKTQSGNLNVRSGAGTAFAIAASLAKGEDVLVLSTSSGWSRILYHGARLGYVSSQYLSIQGQSPSTGAVSLKVQSFKQTDRRWANVKIGTSGKTIAQIGCTTTAVAMMESYRQGKTIYPDVMSKQLSYSSSGDLYWPSHFQVVASGSNYLQGIYNRLKAGKPVLFGAKKANGSQHWVVVTGYTGGSTLTASGFTVNDPGSVSRTNLQHLLNDYPVFYKYFYYK